MPDKFTLPISIITICFYVIVVLLMAVFFLVFFVSVDLNQYFKNQKDIRAMQACQHYIHGQEPEDILGYQECINSKTKESEVNQ